MFTFHHSMQEKFDECMPKDEDEVITIQCVGYFLEHGMYHPDWLKPDELPIDPDKLSFGHELHCVQNRGPAASAEVLTLPPTRVRPA